MLHQETDPLDEIKQSIDQQMASISILKATFEERFDHIEDQLSTFLQYLEESRETQSIRKHMAELPFIDNLNE